MPIGFNRIPDERPTFGNIRLITDSEDPVSSEKGRLVDLRSKGLEVTGEYIGTGVGGAVIFGENVMFNGRSVYHNSSAAVKPTEGYMIGPSSDGSLEEARARYTKELSNQVSNSQSNQ